MPRHGAVKLPLANDSFLEQVAVNALGGIAAALFAGLLALFLAKWFTAKRERQVALRARSEAAAEEFYRAYGNLFAAWKAWDDSQAAPTRTQADAEFLSRVADAEGLLESFLVRLTLERRLSKIDEVRLWCFRRGYKTVRYSVRRGLPVPWARSRGPGTRPYLAFKKLTVEVASMIARPVDDDSVKTDEAAVSLAFVTGSSQAVRERCGKGQPSPGRPHEDDPLWWEIAEELPAPTTRR